MNNLQLQSNLKYKNKSKIFKNWDEHLSSSTEKNLALILSILNCISKSIKNIIKFFFQVKGGVKTEW